MSEVGLDLYDDEEIRSRFMQGVSSGYSFPIEPIAIPTPCGLSPLSSIGIAEKEPTVPQLRPTLSAPKQNIMIKVLAVHDETERLTSKKAQIFDLEISQTQADITRLADEKQEALLREAEAVKARATYSTLSNVAQYVTYVGIITVGAAIGGIPGGIMIASGIVGVGNRVIHDTHLLQAGVEWYTKSEELQKQITHNIEMGAFVLQMGLGLAGGFAAWQTGALAAAQINGANIAESAKTIISGAGTVISMGAKVGETHYDKKIAHLQADMKDIDTKTVLDHQAMYNHSAEMTKMIELSESEAEVAKKSIQAQEVSQD